MLKPHIITTALLLLALCFTAPAFAEEDATMHQVYLAAEAGKFNEAQAMMDKVLRDHPKSAKHTVVSIIRNTFLNTVILPIVPNSTIKCSAD